MTTPHTRQQATNRTDRHLGSVWIEQNRATLPNNNWVAATAAGLVAQSTTSEELMTAIDLKGIDPAEIAIAFITTDAV